MLLILLVVAFGAPLLWAVSVGALREASRARDRDPRTGCQAWVEVRGLPGRRYRCCEPVYAGGRWCRRHEILGTSTPSDPDVTMIDEPQAVGRAIAQARIGVPLAVVSILASGVLVIWALQRGV